ncbi:hypothetical protein [Desertivirga xinjiangensis]|uniref:hypothetical protein n=1 Tax=Desertivirga xinjiangensis TaxID=539206 RepID=UPI00210A9480|nr:hypothetical protein [Pedobacter xinjiangensis]
MNVKYFKNLIGITFFLLSTLILNGQTKSILPVSPEAAALAKMVEYPVDLNTGIPNIQVPIYDINIGGMSLPVKLTYHSGGFKINEQATRAGLGWSLSSDLQISRTINGIDDLYPPDQLHVFFLN